MNQPIRHSNRPRAIAIARPAPYAGPGHLVILAALAVLAMLLFSGFSKAHAGNDAPEPQAQVVDLDQR